MEDCILEDEQDRGGFMAGSGESKRFWEQLAQGCGRSFLGAGITIDSDNDLNKIFWKIAFFFGKGL